MVHIIWEFLIDPSQKSAFEQVYGSQGDWVQLLQQSQEFQGTLLLKDKIIPDKYFTIDRWATLDAFEQFKMKFASAYQELDQVCEKLTLSEHRVGIFEDL